MRVEWILVRENRLTKGVDAYKIACIIVDLIRPAMPVLKHASIRERKCAYIVIEYLP